MSLPAPYSEVYEAGTGAQVEFPFGNNFKPISAGLVKCKVYFSDGYETVPTYTVDMAVGSITISALTAPDGTILTAPPIGSTVRIYRDEPEAQNVTASQLQAYTAKQLEIALDAIVAMIQEVSYTLDHKTVRLTEPQRDIALQQLSELEDGHLIYWDNTERKLVVTNYPQQDVVRCVNGLFFRLRTDPDTHNEFLQWSVDNSNWTSINVDAAQALAQSAYDLADDAYNLASTTRGELNAHKANHLNPHETSMTNLIDTDFNNLVSGQFLQFDGIKWKNVNYSAVYAWGGIGGNIDDQTDLKNALDAKVNLDGSSIMTGPLKMRATSSFQCAIAPFWDGVGFFKLNSDDSVTLIASIDTPDGFLPWVTNTYNIGSSLKKWKNLYLAGTAYITKINNGYDLLVPARSGTLATKEEVDLAANSGRMILDQGVWYAKMYAATVAPSAENGTNYADFSQVDGQGNPIIVIYERQNGAWVQSETITPPSEYDGYVPITSKIWDIPEQAGQQGGRILWNHQSKEFTPYPQIVSSDGQNITNSTFSGGTITNSTFSGTATLSGTSTVVMPQNPSASQIANKDYVDNKVSRSIGNGTITITQGGETKGSFTTNQDNNTTIDLDAGGGGTGRNIGDIFFTMRNDNELNGAVPCDGTTYQTTDYTGSQAPGVLLQGGKIPYVSLATYATLLSTQGYCDRFGWDGVGTTAFRVPTLDLHHAVVEVLEPTSANPYWYRRYADGWVEQGGEYVASANAANVFVPFPLSMADTDYTLTTTYTQPTAWESNTGNTVLNVTCRLAGSTNRKLSNGFYFNSVGGNGVYSWRVSGKASVGSKTLYQRVMVQLAVSTTDQALETCTSVLADVAALKYDYVVDFQAPTAANNYTWYRKYRSGWVEQGRHYTSAVADGSTTTFPIQMANTYYSVQMTVRQAGDFYLGAYNQTTTGVTHRVHTRNAEASSCLLDWQVSGMYAQS